MAVIVLKWFRAPLLRLFAGATERVVKARADLRLPPIKRSLVALTGGWLCVVGFGTPCARAANLESADLNNPDVIALGKARFNRSCFYCHGYEGSGGKAATLQRRSDLTPEVIFNTISNGKIRGSAIMPPWKNTLSEEEITQLVAYILSLREMPEQK
jgi:mono/diheme cytochrome c family protein